MPSAVDTSAASAQPPEPVDAKKMEQVTPQQVSVGAVVDEKAEPGDDKVLDQDRQSEGKIPRRSRRLGLHTYHVWIGSTNYLLTPQLQALPMRHLIQTWSANQKRPRTLQKMMVEIGLSLSLQRVISRKRSLSKAKIPGSRGPLVMLKQPQNDEDSV